MTHENQTISAACLAALVFITIKTASVQQDAGLWRLNTDSYTSIVKRKRVIIVNKKAYIVLLLAALIIPLIAGCGINNKDVDNDGYSDLKSFNAVTLDGKGFTEDDLGDVDLTIINIWSTTCGPCLREMPALAELEHTLPDNIRLITYCFDASANPGYAQEILNDAGFEGVTLIESDGDLESLLQTIQYVPTTVFFDSHGDQIGKAVIGSPNDPLEYYTQAINDALESLGKETI